MNKPVETEHLSPKLELARQEFMLRNRRNGTRAGFQHQGELRHDKQMGQVRRAQVSELERMLLLSKYEKGSYFSSGQSHHFCCLFNLIIACEWNPGYYELEQLRSAFDEAASLLFDATDGHMSFNRIIIGGPELMDCADIQIFASNRLYPRAWVNGLHIQRKYQPIRIGRGYWRKSLGRADAWHENLGPAVIVHEWCHYALGLKDDYIKLSDDKQYAVPTSSPIVKTLMANLESSELIGKTEWKQLLQNPFFTWLFKRASSPYAQSYSPQDVPPELAPRPMLELIGTLKNEPDEHILASLNWKEAGLEYKLAPDHCWVFVLTAKDDSADALEQPGQLIAQGSYETLLPEGYRIIGARKGAYLILIGQEPSGANAPRVLLGKISGFKNSLITVDSWDDVTPGASAKDIPVLAVIATALNANEISYKVDVAVKNADKRKWTTHIFPLGQQPVSPGATLQTLDGQVLMTTKENGKRQLSIAHYSYGYSPPASYPAGPNPVPAGSSDGNAMVFFYDEEAARIDPSDEKETSLDSSLRIMVTTNILSAPGELSQGPRSYTFALLPNETLRVENGKPLYYPTLVLYFDQDTLEDSKGRALKIHRLLENGSWEAVKNQQAFPDRYLVAAQLNQETAPGLFAAQPAAEYYRLFLV